MALQPFDGELDTPAGNGLQPFDGSLDGEHQSAIGYGISQAKAGALGDLPEMAGKALQYAGADQIGAKLRNYGEAQQAANPVDESQNGLTKFVAGGIRGVSSMAPALVAAPIIAGGVAANVVAPEAAIPAELGIAGLMGLTFGGAQGQDTLEKARAAGLPEDQAISTARKTAAVSGLGMAGVGALTAGLGGPLARSVFGTGVKTAEDAVVNAAAPAALKQFAQDTAVSTVGNEAAMTSAAAANAKIEQDAGLPGPTPGEAALQASKDALAFSLVHAPFGGLHTALAVHEAKAARDQLTNADTDPDIRAQHAKQIFDNINQVDPDAAQNFANNAQEAIKNQEPLTLDENVIKPAAGASATTADESQPLSLVPIDEQAQAPAMADDQPAPQQDQRLVPVSQRQSPTADQTADQSAETVQQQDPRLVPVSERTAPQASDESTAPAGPLSAAADIGRATGAVQMRAAEQDAAQSPIEGALESAAGDESATGTGGTDRRQDTAMRKTVANMSPEERGNALLTSDLTGLPNKRAYDEHIQENPDQQTLYGDVDDFKSLNSSYGHNGADQILKAIGDVKSQVAKEMGVDAFHRSGDEFLATHEDPATLESYGKTVQDRLSNMAVEVTNPDGTVSEHTGVGFSYGVGKDDKHAELKSDQQKAERKALGLRTGERDADAVPEQAAGGQQDIPGVLQGSEEQPTEEVKPSAPVDQRLIPISKRTTAKEAENVSTPVETKQAEAQGPSPAADAAVATGKEVSRYSSRQTNSDGTPKAGSGMDAFNAKQFAGVLNRAHPELQHAPVERDNGRFDVVGHEKVKDARLTPVSKREPAAPMEAAAGKPKSSGQRMRDKLESDDPFRGFLAKNGVHPEDKADTGIDSNQRTMVPGYGPIFRKSAPRLDELAEKAHEAGFLSKADIDSDTDTGGTRKLADMIRRSVGGGEVVRRASDEGVKASQSADDQLLQHPHDLGIETDGKTGDQVYDEVVQHHADEIESKLEDADIPFDENDPRLKQETLSDDEIDKLFGTQEASGRASENTRSEDAGGRGAGTGEAQGNSRQNKSPDEVNQFSLSSETADQARARIATDDQRQSAQKKEQEQADKKSKADSEVGNFRLTGSDRGADADPDQEPLFSRKQIDTNDHLVNVYSDLAKHDAAFNLPHSESKSLKGVLSDVSPKATIEDISPHADIGEYSLNDAWKNVEKVSEIKMPGEPKHFALVFETSDKKVWIDISQWKPGASGTDIYQAVATYAHNTGKKFVGDPLGLSQEAAYRRTEQMISSALRHGTTDHLEPGKRQMEADPTLGDKIKPIDWKQNNDAHNLRELLTSSYYNVRKAVPEIDGVTYNFAKGRFETAPDSAARKLADASVPASDGRPSSAGLRADETAGRQSSVRPESGQGSDRGDAGRGETAVHDQHAGDVGNVDAVPFTNEDFRRLTESVRGRSGLEQSAERGKAADTIGLRTLKRAVLTGSVLREEGSPGGRAVLDHVSERTLQRLSPELKRTLYKRDSAVGDSLLSTGTSVDELKSHIASITDKWENSPKISVVKSADDLPFNAPKDARGAYKSGKVYLLADNIESPEQAQSVLFHETLGHAGLRGFFGDKLDSALKELSSNNKNIKEAAAKWREENKKDLRDLYKTEASWEAASIDEVLAEIAEKGEKITGWQRFRSVVQKLLRAFGFANKANEMEAASDAEVKSMLFNARKFIEKGKTAPDLSEFETSRAEREFVGNAREATAFERNSGTADEGEGKFSRIATAPSYFYEYGKIKDAAETLTKGLSDDERTRDISRGKFRETLATIDRNTGAVDSALETSRRYFQSIPNEARWKAMDQFQKGGVDNVSDKNARAFFKAWKANSDQRAAKIQGWDEDFLKETIPNYFSQLWKDPKSALEWYQQMLGKRSLEGGKNFLKQRTYASYKEGMSWKVFDKDGGIRFFDTEKEAKAAAGADETVKPPLEPISSNPTDIMQASLQQVDKFIAMHEFRQWLNEKGWVKAVKQGTTAPDGWAKVDDPTFRSRRAFVIKDKQTGEATDAGIVGHDYMVPALVARDLNNYLSKGLEQYKLWRDFRYVQNFMLSARLGFSAFHAGFTTMDTMVSHVDVGGRHLLDGDVASAVKMWGKALASPLTAPLEGRKLLQQFYGKASADANTAAVLDFLTKGGARGKMSPTDFNNSMHALRQAWDKGDWKGTALHALPAVMEGVMAPIANHLVPWQKMTARTLLAKFELDHIAEKLGKQKGDYAGITKAMNEDALRQIAYKVVQQVDDRLGQVAYDNMFWNKMAKQVAQASIQSVGWNVGTANVVLGGAKDVHRLFNPEQLLAPLDKAGKVNGNLGRVTGRLSYLIALNLTVGMMGAGLQYAMTGQNPKDLRDIFFPRTGRKNPDGTDERISLPSYIKDEYALTQAPIQTVQHKLHPSLSMIAELLNNQDFYGNQIVNPDDPWTKVAGQVADYLGTGVLPYAVSGLQQNMKKGTSPAMAVAPFIGITPASAAISRTPFEAYVNEKYQAAFHTSKTPESAEKAQARSDAINAIKNKETPDLSQFTPQERLNIYLAARTPMQESLFKRLTLQQKISAYDKATPEEIKNFRLKPIVMKDFAQHGRQMDEDEQARAKEILNKPL